MLAVEMTVVLLLWFEDIAGEGSGLSSPHIAGLEILVELRGSNQLARQVGRELFGFAYA